MVAVTVILAAVIAAFVFGMAGNIQKSRIVAATADHRGANNDIYVTYQGGPDSSEVASLNTTLNEVVNTTLGKVPGSSLKLNGTSGKNNHVVVVATFLDGATQVILDTFV